MIDRKPRSERGVVLPVALILLVIVSFAGLYSARNSANHEQFSNNLRTMNVARHAAELGLRYCERVVIDQVENEGETYPTDAARVLQTEITGPDDNNAAWRSLANWSSSGANRIIAPLTYASNVDSAVQLNFPPTCIAQLMADDQFVITSRGLSNDAQVDANGRLTRGSEIWLQAVLTPGAPLTSNTGGIQ
jgi:type IV pilus assembly protein PilX